LVEQWEPYSAEYTLSAKQALEALMGYMEQNNLQVLHATTRIIIVPGYTFRMIGALLTNFHQPKSTLLLLLAAFVGENWRTIYRYALEHEYRFLSYGDSSLLMP
jgi:S-adenosylmethionine:tRNA ribosyltransferase-isomerase